MNAICKFIDLHKVDLLIGKFFVQIGKKYGYLPLGQGPYNSPWDTLKKSLRSLQYWHLIFGCWIFFNTIWVSKSLEPDQAQHFFPNCLHLVISRHSTGPHSAVGNVSGYSCVSGCRSRGCEFDPGRYHTFVEIDHEIISTVILLPSAEGYSRKKHLGGGRRHFFFTQPPMEFNFLRHQPPMEFNFLRHQPPM